MPSTARNRRSSRTRPRTPLIDGHRQGGPPMAFTRRSFIQAAGSGLGAAALGFPVILRAQTEPIRIGLLTVKTGPLASGGIDMERALTQFLGERNNALAGRKVELFVADSAGVPAQARTKLQEPVERNKMQVMI